MPKAMEEALKREAAKKGLSGEAADRLVYGTMRKAGWVPSTQKKKPRSGMVQRYNELKSEGPA
jgi:hypothetical protein